MKLINEGNWKQELALLRAERIEVQHDLDKAKECDVLRWKVEAWANWKFKKLDKPLKQ